MGREVVAAAASGTLFAAVALAGGGIAVVGSVTGAWPSAGAGLLALLAGVGGATLSRAHARLVLQRDGLVAEIENEVARLEGDHARLTAALARTEDRIRAEAEVVKELAKEERGAREIVSRRADRHRDALDVLELRLAALEDALRRAQLKVELRR